MKTAFDPRHLKRRETLKYLFAEDFTHQPNLNQMAKNVVAKLPKIDNKIEKAATAWPVDKLNRIDLAILRLAIYEMENENTPPKVVIDEAVELAKEFGAESSAAFVNGVLGTIYSNIEKEKKSDG
ncbi:transcription antitermination factor NusB [Candidatus Woesebacteria bacterium RBG_19FT_COMBO_42_9]|uniref:Transcription antitermination protein NusB n=1 Tax=Candidatus Woesebacteria bacterium RBG_16_42_24 TaxID=1802485 RepID=A0A1F7XK73_9BACT|nr:MAG: transcription antitermination factor NusB [Candidatus Woesebacteria bacterium RBG_16_42_24]OGM16355.1 MAG: transcription antitermination factor NusB [Candidatus Woesebacteria bacterium RBG_19FT_COMBO_42_9]OGM67404.1 MAG: transcription antitermination factor NusB [Candidatus Woesebacteria bacterium RIFCSPLOWO2_01_FULL_43_11]